MSELDILLGIRSLEGIRLPSKIVTSVTGTGVILLRVDGDVMGIYARRDGRVAVVRMRDGIWPFLPGHPVRVLGDELDAVDPGRSVICSFMRRPDPPDPEGTRSSIVIRRPDVVVAVDESSGLVVLKVGVEAPPSARSVQPLSSAVPIEPGTTCRISMRPIDGSFMIERMVIMNADMWFVRDVRIGGRCQLSRSGGVPGGCFDSSRLSDKFISFESLHPGVEFTIDVTYVGNYQRGITFIGQLIGMLGPPAELIARWTPDGVFEQWMTGRLDGVA